VQYARPLVTEKICFWAGSAELLGSQDLIVEGIASWLHAGARKIRLLEIGGYADGQEADGWNLAFRRAEAVRCRLTRYGVDPKRLFARRYRAQPGDAQAGKSPCGSNRYVAFTVIEYLNAL
jgi:outer membrane protein OmpA-like peptidoglycan-associated protein